MLKGSNTVNEKSTPYNYIGKKNNPGFVQRAFNLCFLTTYRIFQSENSNSGVYKYNLHVDFSR